MKLTTYRRKKSSQFRRFIFSETTVLDFGERSFVEWDLKDRFYERLATSWDVTQLQLMFRTRGRSGLLFKAQNVHKSQHIHLEVSNEENFSL